MRVKKWRTKVLLATMLFGIGPREVLADGLSRAAFDALYLRDCNAFARRQRCELAGDLDGDGKPERVFKIRARKGGGVGIAVAWADGRFSVLGAGARTPRVRTEVYMDGTQEKEVVLTEPLELEGIVTWTLLPPGRGGFVGEMPKHGSSYLAPSVVGQGIFFSGGDAAQLLYWDGSRWRWLILGF
jgi:hypothetical protein